MDEPKFFDPSREIRLTCNFLPHWQQTGRTYFVTFRLADAVPTHLRQKWEEERAIWMKFHRKPWTAATEREYHSRFSASVERWLDSGHGSCMLRHPKASRAIAAALAYFDCERHLHYAWVIMPNHVHALFSLPENGLLEKVLHSWKSFTSHQLRDLPGAPQPFWQEDYYDRLVRDLDHFQNCIRYIRRNPRKAALKPDEYAIYESDLAKQIQ